jgi:hypothetical protein
MPLKEPKIILQLSEVDAQWLHDYLKSILGWDRDPCRPEARILKALEEDEKDEDDEW